MRGLKPPKKHTRGATAFAAQVRVLSPAGVTGSGTVGQFAKWVGETELGDGGSGLVPTVVAMSAFLAFNRSLANATEATVVFNSADFDTDSGLDTATGIYTTPEAGKYLVTASICLDLTGLSAATDTGGSFRLSLYQNASGRQVAEAQSFRGGNHVQISGSRLLDCAAGDTIKATAYQTLTSVPGTGILLASLNHILIAKLGD